MKVWNIGLLCVLAAVDAVSSLTLSEITRGDSFSHYQKQNSLYKGNIIEELLLEDCDKLEYVRNDSVEIIIATPDVIHSCSKTITRVLNPSNGAVIIIGADKGEIALACLKLNTRKELYYNKYYELPQSVVNLVDYNIYDADDIDIKVYTSRQVVMDKLREFILEARYHEAVELSKHIFNTKHAEVDEGDDIITSVVLQILKENVGYQIMDFAFKLYHDDEKDILDKCFLSGFLHLFNEKKLKIHNRDHTGTLRLSTETDSYEDRWLYMDCLNSNSTDQDVYWTFSPVWKNETNNVVFIFQNPFYGMRLKLDVNTVGDDDRLAWGDKGTSDKRFSWRLMPVGFSEKGQLLLRIENTVYSSCLAIGSCDTPKPHVKGSKQSCTPAMGWIFEIDEADY